MVQLFAGITQAQLLKVSDGSNMTILNGTVFNVENLTLIPSADFTISNTTLGKFTTVTHTTANPYISRVYRLPTTPMLLVVQYRLIIQTEQN